MITEQQFLEAVEIVKQYQKQINETVIQVIPQLPKLKRNDLIQITKVSGKGNLIKLNGKYRVVSFELHATDYDEEWEVLEKKYKDPFELSHEIRQKEIELMPHYAYVKIDIGNNHYLEFSSPNYEYKLIGHVELKKEYA